MDILEEVGSIRPQSLMADDRTPLSSLDMKETNSYGGEKIPKVRKPYTITKQRERWTEEEHNKFLEALQLYGRGWRRIEEHIGTKTAVQIRSHAQKFFSKVARESSSSDRTEILKAIEIPPPRPKRKPSHPYPRKFGNSASQNIPLFKQFGLRSPFTPSMSEQGERSPTSVLSAVGSDDPSTSFFQSFKDVISSPGKSASGSNSPVIGSQSPVSTIQGANMPPSPGLTTGDKPMESYNLPGEKMTSQEVSSAEVATIRLFGKTLPLIDSKRSSSSDVSCMVQDIEPPPCPTKADTQPVNGATGQHAPMNLTMQGCNYVPLSSNLVGNLWNSYSGGTPLPPYYFDLPGENSANTVASHPPAWYFSRTWPSVVTHPQSTSPGTYPPWLSTKDTSGQETQREGSWTGSSTTCRNGVAIGAGNAEVVDSKEAGNLIKNEQPHCSKLKPADTSAFRSWKLGLDEQPRNCLPRKRCAGESEVQSIAAIEDGEGPTIRLCL